MFYFVLKLQWSETDFSHCIVKADTKKDALTMQKNAARYVTVIAGPITGILE